MRTITGLMVGAAVLLAACGDDGDRVRTEPSETTTPAVSAPANADNLEGRTFVADQLIVDGTERPAARNTRFDLSFRGGRVGLRAGCNSMGANYRVDVNRLTVDELVSTAMACEADLMDQDALLAELVTGSPVLTMSDTGDRLVVSTDRITFEGLDQP